MKLIKRTIQKNIEKNLFKGKIIIIYGSRQVGKTTLVKEILKKYPKNSEYFNCDEPDIRQALTDKTSTEIKSFLGNKKIIVLDEAQRVKNIGLSLKLIIDNFSDIQIIATGSSSFDLSNKIKEPLTGRKIEFYLYPISVKELKSVYSALEINRLMEERMIFGMYPDIILNREDKEQRLKELSFSYLYKDALAYQNIKNPEVLEKLLQALALQISNEVSYNELAETVGVDKNTIANHIQILEKAFVIFRLRPFSRNLRNELKKMRKIYFYDTGVRNALINNFNPVNLRQDKG
ncbi:ATP-binding protein, partial [Patescibacteria group bacterium]|nr:ATP-binding protein [Patescibacteria group bacterium]